MKITEEDKAYFAGLLDGEGYISANDSTVVPNLFIQIANNYLPVLLDGALRWGGGTYPHSKGSCKCWTLTGKKATIFLKDIYPYLRIKKEEAAWGIALGESLGEKRQYRLSDKEVVLRYTLSNGLKEAFEKRKSIEAQPYPKDGVGETLQ